MQQYNRQQQVTTHPSLCCLSFSVRVCVCVCIVVSRNGEKRNLNWRASKLNQRARWKYTRDNGTHRDDATAKWMKKRRTQFAHHNTRKEIYSIFIGPYTMGEWEWEWVRAAAIDSIYYPRANSISERITVEKLPIEFAFVYRSLCLSPSVLLSWQSKRNWLSWNVDMKTPYHPFPVCGRGRADTFIVVTEHVDRDGATK